ncbi:hypothetical protein BSM4216_0480 [Bacillus smithii]|nr:hypothetical protein BSM4216_0480 [Bacillus smithii]
MLIINSITPRKEETQEAILTDADRIPRLFSKMFPVQRR